MGLDSTVVAADDVPCTEPPPNVLRAGTGTRHAAHDGTRFDSSYARGKPATFPLTAVISGWQEAVPLMVEGEKTRFWIPGDMAYGDSPGKPNGMLVFDIELVTIED
jgi:hypothetical protein